ncbi:MAG TPA: hypothetical protein P5022_01035, partial [Candidatus Paceibacterota bacterium]|nr:hypothetical protein [Candidatus Paceibacterota bacterium]
TLLAADDVFYFGNAVGESGNSGDNAQVDVSDESGARLHPRNFMNPAPVDDWYDYSRDGRVDVSDENLARRHATNFLTALQLITAPEIAAKPAFVLESDGAVQSAAASADAGQSAMAIEGGFYLGWSEGSVRSGLPEWAHFVPAECTGRPGGVGILDSPALWNRFDGRDAGRLRLVQDAKPSGLEPESICT